MLQVHLSGYRFTILVRATVLIQGVNDAFSPITRDEVRRCIFALAHAPELTVVAVVHSEIPWLALTRTSDTVRANDLSFVDVRIRKLITLRTISSVGLLLTRARAGAENAPAHSLINLSVGNVLLAIQVNVSVAAELAATLCICILEW